MDESPRSAFARALAAARKAIGKNQREFADLVGSDKSTVGHYETDYTDPDLDLVASWCEVLKLRGEAKRRLLDLAALAYLPDQVRAKFEAWYDEHQKLKIDYSELVRQERRVAENDEPSGDGSRRGGRA